MRRNKSGLPKYCSYNVDRHGKRRVRFRKGGFTCYLQGTPWGESFMRAYAAALDGVAAQKGEAGAERTRPGSVSALFVRYYRSPEFLGLKPSTREIYRGILERFRAEHGHRLVREMKREHANAIIGKMSATPVAANNLKSLLATVCDFGVDIGMMNQSVWRGIKSYKITGDGFHAWSASEIAQFEKAHPVGTKPRLAFTLLLYTGQRRGDVIRMGWQHVKDGRLKVVQQKTGRALEIPIHPRLMEVLKAQPRENMTFITTNAGGAYSGPSFGKVFRDWCRAAGLKGCSPHGLRKSAATRLADIGCTVHEIMAITGHTTLAEAERYTAAAEQRRLADRAMARMVSTEDEQVLSNLESGLDKKDVK